MVKPIFDVTFSWKVTILEFSNKLWLKTTLTRPPSYKNRNSFLPTVSVVTRRNARVRVCVYAYIIRRIVPYIYIQVLPRVTTVQYLYYTCTLSAICLLKSGRSLRYWIHFARFASLQMCFSKRLTLLLLLLLLPPPCVVWKNFTRQTIERITPKYQRYLNEGLNRQKMTPSGNLTSSVGSLFGTPRGSIVLVSVLYHVRSIERLLKLGGAPLRLLQSRRLGILLWTRRIRIRIAAGLPLAVPHVPTPVLHLVTRPRLLLRLFTPFPLHSPILKPDFHLNFIITRAWQCGEGRKIQWQHWPSDRGHLCILKYKNYNCQSNLSSFHFLSSSNLWMKFHSKCEFLEANFFLFFRKRSFKDLIVWCDVRLCQVTQYLCMIILF